MSFQISGLPMERFAYLLGMSDEELQVHGARRIVADRHPGYPCRVSLADAQVGERVLLVNYEHLPVQTPYRSRYAIYVRENAVETHPAIDEVPEVLRQRLLSLRAFDAAGLLREADVVEGRDLPDALDGILAVPAIAYVHIHNAKPGCFAAQAVRVVDRPTADKNPS